MGGRGKSKALASNVLSVMKLVRPIEEDMDTLLLLWSGQDIK